MSGARARWRAGVCVMLAAALAACAAPQRASAPQAAQANDAQAREVRVLTLNLWHDKGDWPRRRALILAEVARLKPDLIALQEVLQRPGLRNQAQDLGEALGYRVGFVSVDPPDAPRRYGNAILIAGTGSDAQQRKLEPLDDYRSAAHVRSDKADVDFYATHLHNERGGGAIRARQVASLLAFVDASAHGARTLIAGDFNTEADAPELAALRARYADAFATAHPRLAADPARASTLNPAYLPAQRIDHVFYDRRGFAVKEARIVLNESRDGVWPSDHFGLFVRLQPLPAQR
ncbi:endonuclease/exonuclease/phosphatase family protein [Lysobacter enzymogenes]|uniref:Endonuclease/exonuclease/phosphatase family protein n=1 Tax=Lysobacter enzymogenes TaxID=69 RepID=A0A0S2DIV7_LYSEN|nr:endonuclease/exonuclease/phosphatase family protein [Lysobacter enzymogenes]ALN58462.1 endonuclease/exonuclease/phosphatase family protein [Lysobacter enzymogenes]QCW26842.1 endonuclease/exonuclease/phosphatase family protein [Lysobacter enzymogenes]